MTQHMLNHEPGFGRPDYVTLADLKSKLQTAKMTLLHAKDKEGRRFAREQIDTISGEIGKLANKGKR